LISLFYDFVTVKKTFFIKGKGICLYCAGILLLKRGVKMMQKLEITFDKILECVGQQMGIIEQTR